MSARDAYEYAVESQPGLKAGLYGPSFYSNCFEALVEPELLGNEIDDVSNCTDQIISFVYESHVSYDQSLADMKKPFLSPELYDAEDHDVKCSIP